MLLAYGFLEINKQKLIRGELCREKDGIQHICDFYDVHLFFSTSVLANGNVGLTYQGHVQNIDWQAWVADGQMAGTTGQSLRMEAIKITLESLPEIKALMNNWIMAGIISVTAITTTIVFVVKPVRGCVTRNL